MLKTSKSTQNPSNSPWSEAEREWENTLESATIFAASANFEAAIPLWEKGLAIARHHFQGNDPRLATSLANHGYALKTQGNTEEGNKLLNEAIIIWDKSAAWVDALTIEKRARSSMYHLRMELKHWDTYERMARARLKEQSTEGRAALCALIQGVPSDQGGLEQWASQHDKPFNDSRKLLSAVLFLTNPYQSTKILDRNIDSN